MHDRILSRKGTEVNAITRFAKAHTALIGAVATWLVAALRDGQIAGQEWWGLVLAVATGLGVAIVPNKVAARHRKDAGYTLIEVLILVVVVLFVVWLIFALRR